MATITDEQPTASTTGANGKDDTRDALKDGAHKVEAQARDLSRQARDTFEKSSQDITDAAQAASREIGKAIRNNPGLAIAGAAGVGLLIGLAVAARR